MAFKGTRTRSAVNIAEAIEDVGGYINAYTSREATAYYLRLLRQDVRLGVDILADILRNSVYDPREVEVERGVILQEIGQTLIPLMTSFLIGFRKPPIPNNLWGDQSLAI